MGVLVGFPALTTDIYLPGFPAMTKYFNTSASSIQMTLMATMIGIALGQLIIGPLSDKHGRKPPLVVSLVVFILSTIGCIYSKNINLFIAFRFLQGLSCSSGMVLSRAILADTFSGPKLSKSLAINTAIMGCTPAIAPVIGGLILTFSSWYGEFVFLLLIGIIFLFSTLRLNESLPAEQRKNDSSDNLIRNLSTTLSNKNYLFNVLIYAFATAVMFAYISSSPFIFQEHYKISPILYGVFFGTNAIALAFGAILSSRFNSQERALQVGACGLIVMNIATAIALFSGASYIIFELSIFIMFVFNGLNYASATTLALESTRKNAGTASAILGAMSFLFGGIVAPLAGVGDILSSTSIAMILCSCIVFMLVTLRFFVFNSVSLRLAYLQIFNKFSKDRNN